MKNLVSITEANRNFSKIARAVDENESVVILKNNAPKDFRMEGSLTYRKKIISYIFIAWTVSSPVDHNSAFSTSWIAL